MRAPPPSSSSSSSVSKTPCCSKVGIKRGPWTPEEDEILTKFVQNQGEGRWRTLPNRAGLKRCGKSCRLRWMNYLRPSIKRGHIDPDEEDLIIRLHRLLGNRWSLIAGRIPGRTDNEIKNYWNTHLSKKLIRQGIDPRTHKPLITTTITKATSKSYIINPSIQQFDHESNYTTSNPHTLTQISGATPNSLEIGCNSQTNTPIPSDGNRSTEGYGTNNGNGSGNDEFLLFLDSLINESEEVGTHGQPLQQADHHAVFPSSLDHVTSFTQSLDLADLETEFRSALNEPNGCSPF